MVQCERCICFRCDNQTMKLCIFDIKVSSANTDQVKIKVYVKHKSRRM